MMNIKKIKNSRNILTVFISLLFLSNCSSYLEATDNDVTLDSLKKINQENVNQVQNFDENNTIRDVALHEMALSMGMRGGLYSRSKEINQYLSDNSSSLDQIFDFRELMLPDRIVPPVLIESHKAMVAKNHDALPVDDDAFLLNNNPTGKALAKTDVRVQRAQNNFRTLRITDRLYKIIKQARFGVTVPSWNDYLQMDYSKPMQPEAAILPKNEQEQRVWARGIDEGWKVGLEQADQILDQNLRLLKRDYLGMIRYKKLLAMKMVSEPFVAKRNYGVTGDGDAININDRVLTISALPALNPDSKNWQPYLIQDKEQELESKLAKLDMDSMFKYLKAGKGFVDPSEMYEK